MINPHLIALKQPKAAFWLWFGPLVFMFLVGLYYVGRYQGHWAENDSALFTNISQNFLDSGQLVPPSGEIYSNGYTYQSITAFLVTVTGLDIPSLQQLIFPLLAALIVLPAWLLYRELAGSAKGATITTLLLFTQPEFLFVILRSSHEKFTRALLLLALYWLVRSFKVSDKPGLFATHILLFYLTAYAMIASNNLMSNSFIFSVGLALALGWGLGFVRPGLRLVGQATMQRLTYVVLICLALVFLFTFYAYTPAQNELSILKNILDRTAALFLDVQKDSQISYNQAAGAWVNLPVYFLLSIANWLVLGLSFLLWCWQGFRWVILGRKPSSQVAWLLWLFYAAFAAQGVLSVVADASGYIGNFQNRVFPSFSIFGVAMVGVALTNWQPPRFASLLRVGLSLGVFFFTIFAVLKSTNEPLLSNKWVFYRPSEIVALDWGDQNLHNSYIWTDFDERLNTAFGILGKKNQNNNHFDAFEIKLGTRVVLASDVTRLRVSRLKRALPIPPDSLRIYDNGEAQLYRFRSQTPYQK